MSASGEFFYYSICHFCKSNSKKLQRCGSCKKVYYCSKEHQKLNWRNHKELCKVISSVSKNMAATTNCTYEEWKKYRISCQAAWSALLKRQLEPFECQMWMFPRVCGVCYSEENLMDCANCRNVTYCSTEHMQNDKIIHEKFCDSLKLCLDIDRYLADGNCYPQPHLSKIINSVNQLPKNMNTFMDLIEKQSMFHTHTEIKRVLQADAVAPGAIILYAMEVSKIVPIENEIVIHMVGSSAAEGTADWRIATELIFHRIPSLRKVTFIFIGPEAWVIPTEILDLCPSCKLDKKVLHVKVFKRLYHEIIDAIEKPNVVISFNSGISEFEEQHYDQWKKSIPVLLSNLDTPLVFTAYTEEEMLRDMHRVTAVSNLSLSVLVCGRNPFASPRPIRDWGTKDVPVFYSNGYITIIKRDLNV